MSQSPTPQDAPEGASEFLLRPIRAEDEAAMARIIREVMTEFGAVGSEYSIADPEVDHMARAYGASGATYHVIEAGGRVVGGAGIAPLEGAAGDICELRKMYLLGQTRGQGLGRRLLEQCLADARRLGYSSCYLETLEHMQGALALYRRHGFRPLEGPLGCTGHGGCNTWMILEL